MKIGLKTVAALLLLGALGGLAFMYSGLYNVAATHPHTTLGYWVLHTAMEYSVRRHARGIRTPDLSDPALVQKGFRHYHESCVTCHGAPALRPTAIGLGLEPKGPYLMDRVQHWSAAELFWITKNGVKMTGMPAWQLSHDDAEIWAIIAFLQELPRISPQAYRRLALIEAINAGGPPDR